MHSLFEQSELRDLIEKVEKGERLDLAAGIRMMSSQDILAVGYMANFVRERKSGSQTFFAVNRPVMFGDSCSALAEVKGPDAVMCYGGKESPEERIKELLQFRAQQDRTGEFLTFAPLPFYSEETNLEGTMGVETTMGIDDLKMLAVSRIILDNVPHIKGFWVMLGPKLAQVSLAFGVDYLDGTVWEGDKAGLKGALANQTLSKRALIRIIQKAGRAVVEQKG